MTQQPLVCVRDPRACPSTVALLAAALWIASNVFAAKAGEPHTMGLRMPDGAVVEITIDRAESQAEGGQDLFGHLASPHHGSFTLVERGSIREGVIHAAGMGSFTLSGPINGPLCVQEVQETPARPVCLVAPLPNSMRYTATCPDSVTLLRGYPADDGSMIDVMVVYTPQARDAAGGVSQIEAKIDLAIANTNQALSNSGISSPRVRVIRKALVTYTETGDALTDLNNLVNFNNSQLHGVHLDRDTYGADLVSLWVSTLNTGGAAYEPFALGPDDDGRAGFSVLRQDNAGAETLAHEIGHNFGCQHDRPNAQGAGFFYYSYGYREPGGLWKDLMAYPPGTTILYYSNPNLSYSGPLGHPGPMGVGGNDPNTACNNTLTIVNTAWTLANFRPSTLTTPPASRLYVKPSAPPGGNGSSWATAMQDCQQALCRAVQARGAVQEIWVAAGTYKPDRGRNDRLISFRLANSVALYGGFAGNETLLSQRNFVANPTILSGDIGTAGDSSDNSYHVITASDLSATAVLDGFVITGGNANGASPHDSGSGFWSLCGSPTIRNCTVTGNSAAFNGGGIYINNCSPQFTGCTFSANSAQYGGAFYCDSASPALTQCTFSGNNNTYLGGGLYIANAGAIVLSQCNFNNNNASYAGAVYGYNNLTAQFNQCVFTGNSAFRGGGIFVDGCAPAITGCTFTQNSAGSAGSGDSGALCFQQGSNPTVINCTFNQNSAGCCGGAVGSFGNPFTMSGCTFTANTADYGAGIWTDAAASPSIVNCLFFGNTAAWAGGALHSTNSASPTYVNCVFSGNRATNNYGGAAYNLTGTSASYINCSFSANSGGFGAGAIWADASNTVLTNSIFWQNTDSSGATQSAQITNYNGATASVNYCILQGLTGLLGGVGNLGLNPLFVNAAGADNIVGTPDDNLRLTSASPAIDSGKNVAVPLGITTDAAGNQRFAQTPCTPDTGAGAPPIVDRGAYEFLPLAQVLGDLDGNGTVNTADIPGFVLVLLNSDSNPAHVAATDMNCDGLVNGKDVQLFVARLLGP